jgi:hypothetical protein
VVPKTGLNLLLFCRPVFLKCAPFAAIADRFRERIPRNITPNILRFPFPHHASPQSPSLRLLISCLRRHTWRLTSAHAADPAPADVASALKRSADWHLSNPSGIDTRDWIIAPLYDGLIRTSLATGDPKYLAEVLRFGTQSGWMAGNRKYHADDHAVGHAWIDIYQMDPSRKERLAPMKARIDDIIANPITEELQHGKKPSKRGISVSDRWTWCDALYMGAPHPFPPSQGHRR